MSNMPLLWEIKKKTFPKTYTIQLEKIVDGITPLREVFKRYQNNTLTFPDIEEAYQGIEGIISYCNRYTAGRNPLMFLNSSPEFQRELAIGLDRLNIVLMKLKGKKMVEEISYNELLGKITALKDKIYLYKEP